MNAVVDLAAAPFFLRGSGYAEGSLSKAVRPGPQGGTLATRPANNAGPCLDPLRLI